MSASLAVIASIVASRVSESFSLFITSILAVPSENGDSKSSRLRLALTQLMLFWVHSSHKFVENDHVRIVRSNHLLLLERKDAE